MVTIRHFLLISILIFSSLLVGCAGYATAVHVHEINNDYVLHVPVSKLAVTIPKNGFIQRNNRIGGGTDNPRYFYFVNDSRKIIISGWFDAVDNFPGINKIWDETKKTYSSEFPPPIDMASEKIGNWDAIIYDIQIPDYTNSHIRANWLQAGTWIDIHISITTKSPSSEARSELITLLKAIEVKEL
jgi:hypothetical protein